MKIGYARISTSDQVLDLQIDSLLKAGVAMENIYTDVSSGIKAQRPGMDKMLMKLRKDDEVIVWRLDRIGRNLSHILKVVEGFNHDGVVFRSIQEPMMDTSTPMGKMFIQFVGMFAEFERNSLIERTNAGLASARKRGRIGGRRPGLNDKAKRKAKIVKTLYIGGMPVSEICTNTGIKSKATIYSYLRFMGVEPDGTEKRKKSNYTDIKSDK